MELKVSEVNIAIAFLARMRRCIVSTRVSSKVQEQTKVVINISCCLGKLRECGLLIVWLAVAACCVLHVTS